MASKLYLQQLIYLLCVLYQCSRTCGDGVQYRQAECMRKFENGTTQEARDCSIDEITDLVKPCYNEPCGK